MATVHVFVGQCGNQVGTTFLDTIAAEAASSSDEVYQMRISATHFRPALRRPQHRPNAAWSRSASDASVLEQHHSHPEARGNGVQHYYSLSRFAKEAVADATLPQPRCVLVDMEPKVIERSMQRANGVAELAEGDASSFSSPNSSVGRRFYSLAPQQCVTRGEGSGNNWAFGYHEQGQSRRDAIGECLRRESEQHGTIVSTFHVLHSIAGGTGSGVGCLVAEEVKSLFPRATLLHSVVWPFRCGEVVTQWYNVLMAVSALREVADGVCIAYNDVVAEELQGSKATRGRRTVGEVSYPRMNARISEMLAPLHLPQLLYAPPTPQKDTSRNRIAGSHAAVMAQTTLSVAEGTLPRRYATSSDLVEALALDPAMKFFTGVTLPQQTAGPSTWNALLGEAARTAEHTFSTTSAFYAMDHAVPGSSAFASSSDASAFYVQQRCCLWTLRGRAATSEGIRELRHFLSHAARTPVPLTALFVCPEEGVQSMSLSEDSDSMQQRARPEHAAALYGHTAMIGETLAAAAAKAEELLNVGAFVHHFERYGVSAAELRDAAATVYDTAAAYTP